MEPALASSLLPGCAEDVRCCHGQFTASPDVFCGARSVGDTPDDAGGVHRESTNRCAGAITDPPIGTAHHTVSLHGLIGVYVADPERPTNTISFRFYAHDAIPETRTPRAELGAGGRFGILRIDPGTAGARSWQINLDAGLDALFDMQNKEDSIGWDGTYGLSVTTASPGRFAFKFGISHTSGHLGDEYLERTGIARTNYTRQEVAFGVSRQLSTAWRAYGETGIAYVEMVRIKSRFECRREPSPNLANVS